MTDKTETIGRIALATAAASVVAAAGVPGAAVAAATSGLLSLVSRDILGRPNWGEVAISALQEDIVALARRIRALDETISGYTNPQEVMEIVTQVVLHLSQTTNRTKRQMLCDVAVAGIRATSDAVARKKYFLRITAELEPEHIAIMRAGLDENRQSQFLPAEIPPPKEGTLEDGLLTELRARNLVRAARPAQAEVDTARTALQARQGHGSSPPKLRYVPDADFRLTDLGRGLLAYLSSDEAARE